MTKSNQLEEKIARLEARIAETQDRLLALEKYAILGEMVAGIAHELNTPLGALRSNNDLFRRYHNKIKEILFAPETPEEIRQNAHLIDLFKSMEQLSGINKTAGERMTEIVNSVRRYARQDNLQPCQEDVNELLDSTLQLVRHEFKNRIKINKNLGQLPPICCYPNQLSQVFTNLIVNAAHAIEDKGEISITTFLENDHITIKIGDTGKGITEDNLETIFQSGFTTKSTGLGLGLPLVHRIIDKHNGSIAVTSTVGQGSMFTITLPV